MLCIRTRNVYPIRGDDDLLMLCHHVGLSQDATVISIQLIPVTMEYVLHVWLIDGVMIHAISTVHRHVKR